MSEKWVDVFRRIRDKTHEGTLNWEWEPNLRVLEAQIKSRAIRLAFNNEDYTLSILNSNEDVVDRFTDQDLKEASSYEYTTSDMRKLYESARRIAFNADSEIDRLLKDLGPE